MSDPTQTILRARTLLPVTQPPVENGAIIISGNRIQAVGSWPDLQSRANGNIVDLGDVLLLPGLINAHCHLDYTDMAGTLPPPKSFIDWIPLILAAKSAWGYSEYLRSWLNGAHMLARTGTTTVADIEAVPDLLPEAWDATPLRVFSFLEMTGIRARREPGEILHEAVERIQSLSHPRCRAWLSPHAPYSTLPALLRLSAEVSRERGWRLSIHVAESQPELDMFLHGRGEMYNWMQRNTRDLSDCGLGSPVQHLARCEVLGENLLAIHVNLLERGDVELLGGHRAHVVHCPRSHDYFRHPPFQRRQLAEAGVNVCLGTDSLATVLTIPKRPLQLDLFAEMRALAAADTGLAATEILRMATVNGARALGLAGQIGELAESALADLIAIPARTDAADAAEAALAHTGPVSASMVDGQWIIPPN